MNTELNLSGANSTTGIRARRARPSTWFAGSRVPRRLVPVLWGVVLAASGVAVWVALPEPEPRQAEVWTTESGPVDAGRELSSEIRASAGAPDLLKLEWPPHPDAQGYRVRFREPNGRELPPVTVQSPVFLYDLGSDVLGLPDSFDWEVSAILRDGSEVVTPPRRHQEETP